MNSHRFILEKYNGRKSRYTCPQCNKPHQFTRYIDTETGSFLADYVGICNRSTKCGYHYPPKQYFNDNQLLPSMRGDVRRAEGSLQIRDEIISYGYASDEPTCLYYDSHNLKSPDHHSVPLADYQDQQNKPTDYIDNELFQSSLSNYHANNLISYLNSFFDIETVNHLINIYKIGTSSRYGGGTTIFWQIDIRSSIRTGKVIKYNPVTGRRQKEPFVATNWIHAIHYKKGFNLQQCLFGEHLLAEDTTSPVAIVESEKTAIIAQAKMPEYLWLATGSMQDFKPKKLNVLTGRKVIAFPDLGAYDYWLKKTAYLNVDITVSDYLEKNATEEQKKEGLDIADFL